MELSLDECFDFVNGGSWSEDEYVDGGIHVVKVTNLISGGVEHRNDSYLPESKYEKYKKHKLSEGDVVIATVGSHPTQQGSVVGRTSRIPKEFSGSFLNQNAVCLKNKKVDLVDTRYFFYLTRTVLFKGFIEGRAKGSANQVRMAIGDLKKFRHKFPDLDTQKKISAILSAYDDLIENNKRRIAILEKMAEEIYREWFVRFRFPGYQNAEFEKGIPKGWGFMTLEKAFKFLGGGTPSKENDTYWKDGNVNWFTPSDITGASGIFLNNSAEKPNDEGINNCSAKMFPAYSIMMTSRATIGELGINLTEACTNQGFITCIPNDQFPLAYLFFWLKQSKNYFISLCGGATFPEINKGTFKRIEILKPSMEVIAEYRESVDPIFKSIENLLAQNEGLTKTKSLLLPRLISGKLSVEDLDIKFPPSMVG
jgi:type I restriction enzyme S subunit